MAKERIIINAEYYEQEVNYAITVYRDADERIGELADILHNNGKEAAVLATVNYLQVVGDARNVIHATIENLLEILPERELADNNIQLGIHGYQALATQAQAQREAYFAINALNMLNHVIELLNQLEMHDGPMAEVFKNAEAALYPEDATSTDEEMDDASSAEEAESDIDQELEEINFADLHLEGPVNPMGDTGPCNCTDQYVGESQ